MVGVGRDRQRKWLEAVVKDLGVGDSFPQREVENHVQTELAQTHNLLDHNVSHGAQSSQAVITSRKIKESWHPAMEGHPQRRASHKNV